MRSLIIHAGGKSERIREIMSNSLSKCWLEINGLPIIVLNILEFNNVVDEILIIVNNQLKKEEFLKKLFQFDQLKILEKKISLAIDDKTGFPNDHGPMLSLKTGIKLATQDIIISIPSDMPFLSKEIIQSTEKYLQDNTIVTIQSKDYFNALIFMSKRDEIVNLSTFSWRRVTDIYRLFPNVAFIPLSEEYSKFFIGINSNTDYELATKLASNYVKQVKILSDEKPKTLIRLIGINTEKEFKTLKTRSDDLFREKCYLLLIRLSIQNEIKISQQIKELFKLESKIWEPINKLINNHCLRDIELIK